MGFDMRGNNGRCPPFLLGGCVLVCIILVCNWWSISSQNYDLIKQIDVLEEQIRICFGERDQCLNARSKLEINLAQLNIHSDEKDTIIKRRDNELTMCTTELESLKNLDASKTESLKTLRTNLDEKKEETRRLNEQITILTAIKTDEAMKQFNNQKQVSKVTDEKTLTGGKDPQNKEGNEDIALDNKETTDQTNKEKDGNGDNQKSNKF